jgi:hypothetical protein
MDLSFFDEHRLTLSNHRWTVELHFKRDSDQPALTDQEYHNQIHICEPQDWMATVVITIVDGSSVEKKCIVTGIDGGVVLLKADSHDASQTVKLDNDDLIMSLGFTLISIDLTSVTANWQIRPDMAEIFGFYDLEDNILLRGEMAIHRIDKGGNVKWSYHGRDIWVNMDGKKEVEIRENTIHLIDFESNEYEIDFNGETLSHRRATG